MITLKQPGYVQDDSIRMKMISYFRGEDFHAQNMPNLCQIVYPSFTRTVVGEIALSKAVVFDIVLPCFLASIAAADRGKHRVILSDGSYNSLSIIMHVGAESGAGKGRALEESLAFFDQWERDAAEKTQRLNKARADKNELARVRIKALTQIYSKGFDPEVAEKICEEKSNINELMPIPHLLMSNVSAQAYTQELIEYGIAVRLESDGTLLPSDTMRIVNKAWSGESIRRTRLSMPDGIAYNPFVVDLVLTQPEFFHRHISDPEAVESGRLARTLVYRYDSRNSITWQPAHEMNDEVRKLFYHKLTELLLHAETNPTEKTPIYVEREAENLWSRKTAAWQEQCQPGGSLSKIKDFGDRMGQHSLRLAGILHLAENGVDSQSQITYDIMNVAIQMTEIFAHHTFAYRIKDYGDFSRQCCREVMLYILKRNLPEVLETELNQALKHHYRADDIKVALYHLQQGNFIQEKNEFLPYGRKAGRPRGRTFINPCYEYGGTPIF